MTLVEIRQKFIELSGRFDLVVDTVAWADNGADFFIKGGTRFLDRRAETGSEKASGFYDITAGDFFLELTDCRVIEEVWVNNGTAQLKMEEVTEEEVREAFPGTLSTSDSGLPAVYFPGFFRVKEGTPTPDFLVGAQTDPTKINGILFPPTDEDIQMEVKGKFYADTLVNDGDSNHWSLHYEMELVWAALYTLEISYRNSEGALDWLKNIDRNLFDIEKDLVDLQSHNVYQMEG